jgi:multidrug resistance efflux pump
MERRVFTKNRVLGTTVIAAGVIFGAGAFAFWPAYVNPASRLYTSVVGFLKVQRFLGAPMEAEAGHPVLHDFKTPVLGEGTTQCDFYNVPVVPTTRVKSLLVDEGDRVKKGQVLAELDDTQAEIRYRSAKLALADAKAQLVRVKAGSVNTMQAERPEKDKADLAGMEKVAKSAESKVKMYKQMEKDGASSKLELVNAEIELANDETNLEQAKISSGMSNQGAPGSVEIAQDAVGDAQNLLQQQEEELAYYRVVSPVDGVVDRVLIRNGEFNQTAGNTGFIVTSDPWFEANLDQGALGDVQQGREASVNFDSYPGRSFNAIVDRVIPIVTFDTGGPATKTPVRPLGTGTPEWPATFKIRLRLEDAGVKFAPGMTGFARIARHRWALAISRDTVLSSGAGKGVVRVVDASNHLVATSVALGATDDKFVEITEGLDTSNWVLLNNPRSLRDNETINIARLTASQQAAKYGELTASQRDGVQAQLKDLQAKVELAQKNGELAASQRDALQVQLKESEAKAQQAQKNGELAASQRDALQAQLKDIQAKAEQAQAYAKVATWLRDALLAQLKDVQARGQLAQRNEQLALGKTNALQAQLEEAEIKAEWAQENANFAKSQRDALQAQLKDLQAKVELTQKNGDLAASQRDASQALLKESEAKAQQAQKNGELAANQRDALQAQLKDIQAKAQQAQGNEKLTLGQTNALQAQLKEAETKAEQAQEDAKAAASQRDALQAQLKDLQAKVELAQKNGELDQVQPNTGIGPSGDTEERPVASDPTPKTELATQDGHDSDSRQARSVRASSESKKGRHVMRHRTVARRQEGPLRAIDHWLHRHLASR